MDLTRNKDAQHQDVAGLIERLRNTDIMDDFARLEAATLIESLSKALSEAEAERDYQTGFVQELQTALAFWMPGVDLRLDEATRELAADDAYLLAGSTGERDLPCWGDGILERALAAESRLAEAMKVIEELLKNACAAAQVMPSGIHRIDATEEEWLSHLDACHSARRFLNAGKE